MRSLLFFIFLHFLNDFGGTRLGFLGLLLLFLAQEFLVFLVLKTRAGCMEGNIPRADLSA